MLLSHWTCNWLSGSSTGCHIALQAVYTALREAEHRSTAFLPYWNLPLAKVVIPRQRRCQEAMGIINSTLDGLVAKCQQLVRVRLSSDLAVAPTSWLNADILQSGVH